MFWFTRNLVLRIAPSKSILSVWGIESLGRGSSSSVEVVADGNTSYVVVGIKYLYNTAYNKMKKRKKN